MSAVHQPVLLREVLEIFDPKPGQIYIDATINGGGHASAILERIKPRGTLLGIDWDCELIEKLEIANRRSQIVNIELVCDNYANLKAIAAKKRLFKVDGILFDLGFSSYHIEGSGRGFTFTKEEPLDMRYNPDENELTAEEIVNRWPEERLVDIFSRYGEERFARRIARGIARERDAKRIGTTSALAKIICRNVPAAYRNARLDPATRTFQALRIAVNKELEALERVLPDAASLLSAAAKIAVISFHSLEDRIVKNFMREQHKNGSMGILTAKSIRTSREEVGMNPRARSARLRAAIKL